MARSQWSGGLGFKLKYTAPIPSLDDIAADFPVYESQFPEFIAFAHDFRDKIASLGRPSFRT